MWPSRHPVPPKPLQRLLPAAAPRRCLRDRAGLDPEADVIGAHQLTIEAGITYRQLDFWTRCGYLTPITSADPGSGRPRAYNLDQIALAREMARILAAGVREASVAHDAALELLATGSARLGDFTLTPRHQETA